MTFEEPARAVRLIFDDDEYAGVYPVEDGVQLDTCALCGRPANTFKVSVAYLVL